MKGINERFIKNGAASVGAADVQDVLDRAGDIRNKVRNSGLLKRFCEDTRLLLAMVRDYWNGNYRAVPWWTIAAIVFALLYVLSPVDLMPDIIPVLGLTDDAAVLALCLVMLEEDISKYREWKERNGRTVGA